MKQTTPSMNRISVKPGRQRGASLLEVIAYLGIAALVVLGAVSLLTNAFGSAKGNQTIEEITALRTSVRKLHSGQAYPVGDIGANLVLANAVPSTLIRGAAGALSNTWGGAVTITGTAASTFTITYTLVPQDVCMGVVSGASGWTSVGNGGAAAAIVVFPVTAANAATICNAATNNVIFTAT